MTGLRAPNAQDLSSILGQGTRPHMPQLKILHAITKTWLNQISKYLKKKKKGNGEGAPASLRSRVEADSLRCHYRTRILVIQDEGLQSSRGLMASAERSELLW